MHEQNIAPEGYSSLIPLTSRQGGPVDKPVAEIGKRLKVEPEQVLLAWSRAKGYVFPRRPRFSLPFFCSLAWANNVCRGRAIVITTSSRKDRLERYLAVGDIALSEEDVEAIDRAGRKGERDEKRKEKAVRGVKWAALGAVGVWALARLVC